MSSARPAVSRRPAFGLDALEPLALEDADLMERIRTTRRLIAEGNSRPFSPERGD
jgi:hypothetical protein